MKQQSISRFLGAQAAAQAPAVSGDDEEKAGSKVKRKGGRKKRAVEVSWDHPRLCWIAVACNANA